MEGQMRGFLAMPLFSMLTGYGALFAFDCDCDANPPPSIESPAVGGSVASVTLDSAVAPVVSESAEVCVDGLCMETVAPEGFFSLGGLDRSSNVDLEITIPAHPPALQRFVTPATATWTDVGRVYVPTAATLDELMAIADAPLPTSGGQVVLYVRDFNVEGGELTVSPLRREPDGPGPTGSDAVIVEDSETTDGIDRGGFALFHDVPEGEYSLVLDVVSDIPGIGLGGALSLLSTSRVNGDVDALNVGGTQVDFGVRNGHVTLISVDCH
jgi:hypothetical protein